MSALSVNFGQLRDEALEETFNFFGRRHLALVLDLKLARKNIEEEIAHYEEFVLNDYLELINAGEHQEVLDECKKDYDEWIAQVNFTRTDLDGSRTNDVSFLGGNETANIYCFELFLAKLNLAIFNSIRKMVDGNIDDQITLAGKSLKNQVNFEEYLSDRGKILIPFIKSQYQLDSKPASIARLLFGMNDLGCLKISMPATGHQDALHKALSALLPNLGTRNGLNAAISRYNTPSEGERAELVIDREKIKDYLTIHSAK